MISVIITTHNRKELLKRSLESVLNQTYRDFEVVIVDDFADDGTDELFNKIEDHRIRYIRLNRKSGVVFAKNSGIDEAKGEIIAFQDDDDIWYENKLQEQYDYMLETGADIVFCKMKRHIKDAFKDYYPTNVKQGKIKYEQLLQKNLMSTQTIFGKRECFVEIKYDEKAGRLDDWDLGLRLIQKYRIYYLDKVLVETHIQEDSISNNPFLMYESINHIYNNYTRPYFSDIAQSNLVLYNIGLKGMMNSYNDLLEKYNELYLKNKELSVKYDEMIKSGSWKITEPYRRLMDLLKGKNKNII